MHSWLVRLSSEQAVRVRALAGDAVLCSWARHFTLSVPLSTQEYKWLPANCWGKPNKLRQNVLQWTSILSRESTNPPSHFMLQKPGISSCSYASVGSKASFFFFRIFICIFQLTVGHFLVSEQQAGLQFKMPRYLREASRVTAFGNNMRHRG